MRRKRGQSENDGACPNCGGVHTFPWSKCERQPRIRRSTNPSQSRNDSDRLNEGLEMLELFEEMYDD